MADNPRDEAKASINRAIDIVVHMCAYDTGEDAETNAWIVRLLRELHLARTAVGKIPPVPNIEENEQ